MSAPQFTPGPWRVDPSFAHDIQSKGGRLEIASVAASVLSAGRKPAERKRDANARLIAAAPELYEALKAIGYWPSVRAAIGDKLCAQLDAAIDKADGQQ